MNKKVILEEIIRINEIMGINSPKLLIEQPMGFLEKWLERESGGLVKSAEDIENAMIAKGVGQDIVDIVKDLSKKTILTDTEKMTVSKLVRSIFPELVEKSIDEIEAKLKLSDAVGFDLLMQSIKSKRVTDTQITTVLRNNFGINNIDEEFVKIWRDHVNNVSTDLEKIGETVGRDINDELSNAIQDGIDDAQSKGVIDEAGNIVKKEQLKARLKIHGVPDDKIDYIINTIIKAAPKTESELISLLKTSVATALKNENIKQPVIDKIINRLDKTKEVFYKLGPSGKVLFIILCDLLVSSSVQAIMYVSTLDKTFPSIYGLFQIMGFRVGAGIKTWKEAIENARKESETPPSPAPVNPAPVNPVPVNPAPAPSNEEELVKKYASGPGIEFNIKSTTHNNDGTWTVTDVDGTTGIFKVIDGKVVYQD